jgi:hypothetical protein
MEKHKSIVVLSGGRDVEMDAIIIAKLVYALQELLPGAAIVGGCPTGVDRWGKDVIRTMGTPVIEMPALWSLQGKRAGPMRNRRMLLHAKMLHDELGLAPVLLAGPGGKGTSSCISAAKDMNIPVRRFGFDEIRVNVMKKE